MSEWKLKRFWTEVSVKARDTGFAVELDGRPVRTPAKTLLAVPTEGLAQAVAAEWAAQEGEIDPTAMPYTRTVNAAIDKVRVQHDEVSGMLADYGESDLLCYRAERPEGLVARQAAVWDPYLDWAADVLGARLVPVTGLMPVAQDKQALARLRDLTFDQSAFQLAAFHDLVSLSGSLVLAFAAARDMALPEQVWDASRLDEDWQIEQWGADEEATEVAMLKRTAFLHAKRVWDLSRVS